MQQTTKGEAYEVIASKLSKDTIRRLEAIAERLGTTKYKIIQMVCDVIVRYMDDEHNLTPEMAQLIGIFEHPDHWPAGFNLSDPSVRKEVGKAIYLVDDPTGKCKGERAVMADKPFMGGRTVTYNVRDIVEALFCYITPTLYLRLRWLACEMECRSLLELLIKLVDLHSDDTDTEEFRRLFEDCQRADNNRPVAYGERTKRKKRTDIEKVRGLFG